MNKEIPVELTDDYQCPDCGVRMHPADPCDPDCEILWCGECGFNEPADEDGD